MARLCGGAEGTTRGARGQAPFLPDGVTSRPDGGGRRRRADERPPTAGRCYARGGPIFFLCVAPAAQKKMGRRPCRAASRLGKKGAQPALLLAAAASGPGRWRQEAREVSAICLGEQGSLCCACGSDARNAHEPGGTRQQEGRRRKQQRRKAAPDCAVRRKTCARGRGLKNIDASTELGKWPETS